MTDNWQALNNEKPELRDRLKEIFQNDDSVVIKAKDFITNSSFVPINEISLFLDKATSIGLLIKLIEYYCPFENCGHPLYKIEIDNGICAECGQAFIDSLSKKPVCEIIYVRHAKKGRDVRWFLALHGMNTRGAWQEEFNWRVANTFGRSLPVAIYKYGTIRFSVLLHFLQKKILNKLCERLNSLNGDIQGNGFRSKPDVIAHSFGTWMIGHLLNLHPEIKVGRIILTGCILRPDFDWGRLISNGQVEAVLNHFSKSDMLVQVTHFFIPDSGPSGFRGMDDPNVINVEAPNHSHSDYFNLLNMQNHFVNVWWPFLQKNTIELKFIFPPFSQKEPKWSPNSWILQGRIIPWLIFIILISLLYFIVALFSKGIHQILFN